MRTLKTLGPRLRGKDGEQVSCLQKILLVALESHQPNPI